MLFGTVVAVLYFGFGTSSGYSWADDYEAWRNIALSLIIGGVLTIALRGRGLLLRDGERTAAVKVGSWLQRRCVALGRKLSLYRRTIGAVAGIVVVGVLAQTAYYYSPSTEHLSNAVARRDLAAVQTIVPYCWRILGCDINGLKSASPSGRGHFSVNDLFMPKGSSILHYAVVERQTAIVRALLDSGANPNVLDADGRTPLHYAVENLVLPEVEVLLKAGGGVEIRDNAGVTPVEVAEKAHVDIGEQELAAKIAGLLNSAD